MATDERPGTPESPPAEPPPPDPTASAPASSEPVPSESAPDTVVDESAATPEEPDASVTSDDKPEDKSDDKEPLAPAGVAAAPVSAGADAGSAPWGGEFTDDVPTPPQAWPVIVVAPPPGAPGAPPLQQTWQQQGPPPPAPRRVKAPIGPARWPVAAALLNLTGLSLGYWYLGGRIRALVYLAITAALVVTAFLTGAASMPWLWRAVAVLWLGWMALDAWRLARRHPEAVRAPRRRPVLVAAAVLVAMVGGFTGYAVAGNAVYEDGVRAQAAADCATATDRYDVVTGPFELTLSRNVVAAEANREFCAQFASAVADHDNRRLGEAVRRYQAFLNSTPANSLDEHVHDRLQRAYLEWAADARGKYDFGVAKNALRNLQQAYPDGWSAEQAHSDLARTHYDEANWQRTGIEGRESAVDLQFVRDAVTNYLLVIDDFADTVSASSAPNEIRATYHETIARYADRHCDQMPFLDYFVDLPVDKTEDVVATAHGRRVTAAFECGVVRYREGGFAEALTHFELVTQDYGSHALAPAASSALIAATIAAENAEHVAPLPPPLGDNSPGSISVTFYNDSSVETEVLLAGPTAHRVVLPACAGCPEAYDNPDAACGSPAGKPSIELRLGAGAYHLMSRDTDDGSVPNLDVLDVDAGFTHTYCLFRSPEPR